jgi:RNA polymerase sigma-70 factor (ECF subfamily)
MTARKFGTATAVGPGVVPANDAGATPLDLADLYRAEMPRLHRWLARHVSGPEASDLAQESFARVAASRPADAPAPERPAAYLQRVAINLLRSRARTALRRSLATHVPADAVPLAGPDPVAALEARDELARLRSALERLKPKTRAVFVAHRVEGLTYNEIASTMGLSVKTVEWHMTKAIAFLDRALGRR